MAVAMVSGLLGGIPPEYRRAIAERAWALLRRALSP
jgi:hypothetical protein